MRHDSEVVLVGTGVAPLAAAARLLADGHSVTLLNPDPDFFGEDSELPFDPLGSREILLDPAAAAIRLKRGLPERAAEVLGPDYPGSIEFWPRESRAGGAGDRFRDPAAPYVRARSRLWLRSSLSSEWPRFEDFFLGALEGGLKPQLLEGIAASRRFPGFAARGGTTPDAIEETRGLLIPRMCDVDVNRYRYGLLEFVRERLGPEGLLCGASQIEFIPDGVRFHHENHPRTIQVSERVLVFWTPRLTPWVQARVKELEIQGIQPPPIRLWEHWVLRSREKLDPSVLGVFEDLWVWGDVEGMPPEDGADRLSVLRVGSGSILSADSIRSLYRLCGEFLRWDGFSIRSHRARAIFDPAASGGLPRSWILSESFPRVELVGGSDGSLIDVVENARAAAGRTE